MSQCGMTEEQGGWTDGQTDRQRDRETTDKVRTDGWEDESNSLDSRAKLDAGMHDREAAGMKSWRLTVFIYLFVGLNSMHLARQAGQPGGALLSLT